MGERDRDHARSRRRCTIDWSLVPERDEAPTIEWLLRGIRLPALHGVLSGGEDRGTRAAEVVARGGGWVVHRACLRVLLPADATEERRDRAMRFAASMRATCLEGRTEARRMLRSLRALPDGRGRTATAVTARWLHEFDPAPPSLPLKPVLDPPPDPWLREVDWDALAADLDSVTWRSVTRRLIGGDERIARAIESWIGEWDVSTLSGWDLPWLLEWRECESVIARLGSLSEIGRRMALTLVEDCVPWFPEHADAFVDVVRRFDPDDVFRIVRRLVETRTIPWSMGAELLKPGLPSTGYDAWFAWSGRTRGPLESGQAEVEELLDEGAWPPGLRPGMHRDKLERRFGAPDVSDATSATWRELTLRFERRRLRSLHVDMRRQPVGKSVIASWAWLLAPGLSREEVIRRLDANVMTSAIRTDENGRARGVPQRVLEDGTVVARSGVRIRFDDRGVIEGLDADG